MVNKIILIVAISFLFLGNDCNQSAMTLNDDQNLIATYQSDPHFSSDGKIIVFTGRYV